MDAGDRNEGKRRIQAVVAGLPLVWFLVSGAALAQTSGDAGGEAKEHFSKGVFLFGEGKFAAALDEFKKSYDQNPHWMILYNIGMCYLELDDNVSAASKLSYFVEEGGKDIDAETLEEVAGILKDLKSKLGIIRLTGNYKGGTLLIDGLAQKRGEEGKDVFLSPGLHEVKLTRNDEVLIEQDVTLEAGEMKEIFVVGTASAKPGGTVETQGPPAGTGKGKPAKKPMSGIEKGAWATAGLAAASLLVGAVMGGVAIKEKKDMVSAENLYMDRFDEGAPDDALRKIMDDRDNHYDRGIACSHASTAFLAVGGASALVSIVLFVVSHKKPASREKRIGPLLLPGPGSISLALDF